ncbi:acyl-CoA N-acyltransferase [Aspergillus egyptiacus]|nr:acyl-CoA N-acyltransferase [Aspergillus egyptiacus]
MPPIRRDSTRKAWNAAKKAIQKHVPSEPPKKRKPLPLVERTNALSLEEFISLYIPSSELSFQKGRKRARSRNQSAQKDADAQGETSSIGENNDNDTSDAAASEFETDTNTYTSGYTVSIYTTATIPPAELNECFDLIELTSSAAYKDSSMGWSASGKRKEMKLPDMKYMILRRRAESAGSANEENDGERSSGEFVGFLEFMVTYEDGYEVLYCYEIHLMPGVQGQGLGEELMGRFERVGRRIGLEKAMLTVFKSNARAIAFYERVGYTEDESSPRPKRLRNGTVKEADYRIMSKRLR